MLEINKIHQGDCFELAKQLDNESINCIVTSPPYWALRDYGSVVKTIFENKDGDGFGKCKHIWGNNITKKTNLQAGNPEFKRPWREEASNTNNSNFCQICDAWKGQLGLEPIFDLYIKHLCDLFDILKQKLRKDGTCWVNLGDTYGAKSGSGFENDLISTDNSGKGIKNGNELRGTSPEMHKNLCNIPARFSIEMQNRGWILRNVIIWHKPNCMPSSVKDRFTVDFEYIFFFVKNKKYWFETQYEPIKQVSIERMGKKWCGSKKSKFGIEDNLQQEIKPEERMNPDRWTPSEGRNKRAVWSIIPKGFSGSHFAVFPEELIETPIKAGCPKEGIVFDPFAGSGTTGAVAKRLGRNYILTELNPEYIELANMRLNGASNWMYKENTKEQTKLSDALESARRVF